MCPRAAGWLFSQGAAVGSAVGVIELTGAEPCWVLGAGGSAACHTAVYGNFSGPKAQEIMVSRGKLLELLRPDDAGKLQTVLSVEVFGQIRSLAAFRLTGASKVQLHPPSRRRVVVVNHLSYLHSPRCSLQRTNPHDGDGDGRQDYVVVGSDSGRFSVLEYVKDKNRLAPVQLETFGKSGCRRIVPGQYVVVDPKGRAAMIGSMEKQKVRWPRKRATGRAGILRRSRGTTGEVDGPAEGERSLPEAESASESDVSYMHGNVPQTHQHRSKLGASSGRRSGSAGAQAPCWGAGRSLALHRLSLPRQPHLLLCCTRCPLRLQAHNPALTTHPARAGAATSGH